jgi:lincosamide nucleotidyltransferase A/C/D/E
VSGAIDAGAVLEIVAALEAAAVRVWLDGGWGVDALLGEQTREHADLDVILDAKHAGALREALRPLGFRPEPGGSESNFVLADAKGRRVDAHPVEFDARGWACFRLADGRRWPFPPAAFAGEGRVAGRAVRCLGADAQVQCHAQGYAPTEKDLRDMERLQQRFGVVLPIALCRQAPA